MKATATLTVVLASGRARSSLQSVLTPDNEGAPHGTRLSMAGTGDRLEFRVLSDSSSVALSTILAVMRDLSLFQEVWLLSHGKGASAKRPEVG